AEGALRAPRPRSFEVDPFRIAHEAYEVGFDGPCRRPFIRNHALDVLKEQHVVHAYATYGPRLFNVRLACVGEDLDDQDSVLHLVDDLERSHWRREPVPNDCLVYLIALALEVGAQVVDGDVHLLSASRAGERGEQQRGKADRRHSVSNHDQSPSLCETLPARVFAACSWRAVGLAKLVHDS